MVIKKLIKMLQLVDQQGINLFKVLGGGYSISSTQIMESIRTLCGNLGTIIDVGANQGQFALATTRQYPDAKVISFEPVPEVFQKLRSNVGGKGNISIHNLALGAESGTIDFYVNNHSHASSALVISDRQKTEIPETSNTVKTQVRVEKLSDFLNVRQLKGPILLKLDVQGYEKNVLEGALSALPAIDFLVFEASFVHMYQGEPLFDEMHSFLKQNGFELVSPVGYLSGRSNAILQMDFLYRNISKNNK
jgi:FkbM family methyltransferase